MATMQEAAADFLGNRRVAVTGVSRTPRSHGSNTVYRRLGHKLMRLVYAGKVPKQVPTGNGGPV